MTTYATFLPCFLFIFFLAPYIELLANDRRLKAILIGVTAAVVGVVANLAVYFATQVLPEGVSLGGLDVFALVVAAVSFVVLQRYKVPIYLMVPAGALGGWRGLCCFRRSKNGERNGDAARTTSTRGH